MIIASFPKGSFPEYTWPIGTWPAAPEGADIQYKEVVEFSLAAILSAEFDVILPNDVDAVTGTIVVSGAGTSDANGTYAYLALWFGKPLYTSGDNSIWWDDNKWAIINAFESGNRYESTEDVATPDLVTTWTVSAGALPVPTVMSDNPISGVTEVAAFTVEMPMLVEMEVYEELSL